MPPRGPLVGMRTPGVDRLVKQAALLLLHVLGHIQNGHDARLGPRKVRSRGSPPALLPLYALHELLEHLHLHYLTTITAPPQRGSNARPIQHLLRGKGERHLEYIVAVRAGAVRHKRHALHGRVGVAQVQAHLRRRRQPLADRSRARELSVVKLAVLQLGRVVDAVQPQGVPRQNQLVRRRRRLLVRRPAPVRHVPLQRQRPAVPQVLHVGRRAPLVHVELVADQAHARRSGGAREAAARNIHRHVQAR
mmetsp:Transcript_30593/g.85699  ORF Transcript_30593/g.85699 Transcript_30593/m.85699 type:complete len:249 (-) Transcript_30593:812-1558(-)